MWFDVFFDTFAVVFVCFVVVLKFIELWNKKFDFTEIGHIMNKTNKKNPD